jgi:hypothetical protein
MSNATGIGVCALLFLTVIIAVTAAFGNLPAQAPAPDSFLSPLKKGTEITLKETPSGYRITMQSPGTHKVIHNDNDFIIITDANNVVTTRIGKHAILAISEFKVK